MNFRSIIIGIIFVVIVVIVGLFLAKRLPKISILDSLRSRFNIVKTTPTPTPTPEELTNNIPVIPPSSDLLTCSSNIFSQNCTALPKESVCGYQKTAADDGVISEAKLEYLNACYFCKFFGSDNVLEMGSSKIYSLGYTAGSCN